MGRKVDGSVVAAWAERLARQQRGTLSIAEFCRRERVSAPSFYAWRRRLKDEEPDRGTPVFVPVELSRGSGLPAGVQIELPGGALVILPAEASAELVTTAIRAAMRGDLPEERRPC